MFVKLSKYYCNKVFSRYNHDLSKSNFPTFVSLQYVKNLGYPTCLDCVYFVPSKYENSPDLGKCSKFAEQELSSGVIKLEWASVMRINERNCGPSAIHKLTIKGDHLKIVHRIQHPETEI
jgi:hypothetical protein